jgi:hypothetical protein
MIPAKESKKILIKFFKSLFGQFSKLRKKKKNNNQKLLK